VSVRDNVISAFDFLRHRRRAYQLTFGSPAGNEVLADLVKFCRGIETCVVPGDHDRTLILEGRREVFLRLTDHLHLTSEQLYALHAGRNILIKAEGEDDAGSES
jgi:hypothetical protein